MEIRSLKYVELSVIIDCLLKSFSDYFVKMPSDIDYWKSRYTGARVNYE